MSDCPCGPRRNMSVPGEFIHNFSIMLETCKDQLGGLVEQYSGKFSELTAKAQSNVESLKESYGPLIQDIAKQTSEEKDKIIARVKAEYEAKKADLEQRYENIRRNSESTFQTTMAGFEKQADEILKQAPMIPQDTFRSLVGNLSERQKKLLEDGERTYHEMLNNLTHSYNEVKAKFQS